MLAKRAKRVVGALGTGVLTLGSAGAAAFLAPVIAPFLATTFFGSAVAGLSGAALTSASLALFGGGALAAGGLGMAGGTVVIAGGGALLGLAGGSGLSAAASIQALGSERAILDECVKMLTYSDVVLVQKMGKRSEIVTFEKRLDELSSELKETREQSGKSNPFVIKGRDKQEKKQLKMIKRGERYVHKTATLLKKLAVDR